VTGINSKLPVAAFEEQRLRHLYGAGSTPLVGVQQVSLSRLVNDQRLNGPLASRCDAQLRFSVTRRKAHVCTVERIARRRIAQIQRNSTIVLRRLSPRLCLS